MPQQKRHQSLPAAPLSGPLCPSRMTDLLQVQVQGKGPGLQSSMARRVLPSGADLPASALKKPAGAPRLDLGLGLHPSRGRGLAVRGP